MFSSSSRNQPVSALSSAAREGVDDDDAAWGDSNDGGAAPADRDGDEAMGGFRAFRSREAKGVLFKLSPIDAPLRERVTAYVHGGAMDADRRFVGDLRGLVDPTERREANHFWESPWLEEQAYDSSRKRKVDARQRAMAVRSYIHNTTTATAAAAAASGGGADGLTNNIDSFLSTVDKLTDWVDKQDTKEIVKTVSRMVQSFERTAITTMIGMLDLAACRSYRSMVRALIDPSFIDTAGASLETVACTLRRSDRVFHHFAALVAAELFWSEGTNGARNTTIYNSKQLDEKRQAAAMGLIRELARLTEQELPHDLTGLPLMSVRCNMCVSHGVLVVMPGSTSATYVLDITDRLDALDLDQIQTIRISRVVTEPPQQQPQQPARRRE